MGTPRIRQYPRWLRAPQSHPALFVLSRPLVLPFDFQEAWKIARLLVVGYIEEDDDDEQEQDQNERERRRRHGGRTEENTDGVDGRGQKLEVEGRGGGEDKGSQDKGLTEAHRPVRSEKKGYSIFGKIGLPSSADTLPVGQDSMVRRSRYHASPIRSTRLNQADIGGTGVTQAGRHKRATLDCIY